MPYKMATTGKQNPSKRLSGLALSRQSGIPGQGEYLVNADILSAIYPTCARHENSHGEDHNSGRTSTSQQRLPWEVDPGQSRLPPEPHLPTTTWQLEKAISEAFKGFTKQRTPGEQLKVFGEPGKSWTVFFATSSLRPQSSCTPWPEYCK